MGLSSNQARFLTLTSRQVDLEKRVQQICQRRLRLANDLEKVAAQYSNKIADRRLFTSVNNNLERLNLTNLGNLGYKVFDTEYSTILGNQEFPITSFEDKDLKDATADEITATGASAAMKTLVNNTEGLRFVTHLNPVRDKTTKLYSLETTTSIAIYTKEALDALINGGGFNNNDGLNLNYILMNDLDMSSYDWNSIGDDTNTFTGTFNGNCHTINNINISSNTGYQGMFANLSGTVKNLNLNNTSIDISDADIVQYIGSIAGKTNSTGQILNSNSSNIDINVDGGTTGGTIVKCQGGITGYVGNGGIVDVCSVNGNINYENLHITDGDKNNFDAIGGFIGSNASNAEINMSYADVNITIPTSAPVDCINVFMGCDAANGLKLNNCYASGDLKYSDGNYISSGNTNPGMGHNINTNLINCWAYKNGVPAYWNGTTTNAQWAGSESTIDMGSFSSAKAPNGANIWLLDGSMPTINQKALSTFNYLGYIPTEDELEQGLRSGKYTLLKNADAYTQQKINYLGTKYEMVDWKTQPPIDDDLYTANDAAAENEYSKNVTEINAQDKKLGLEQANLEVEYKAITNEKEAVNKILDTNVKASFKYFG